MTSQIINVHNASQISSLYINIGIIAGVIFCFIGLILVVYASKYYR